MRSVRVRCDVKGTARRARQRWHCAGCMRTADGVCMLVKLDDMADERQVFVDAKNFSAGGFDKQKRGKSNCQVSFCDFAAETLLVAVLCVTVCGLVADVAHVRAGSLFVPPAVVPSQMISNTCSMFVYQARC